MASSPGSFTSAGCVALVKSLNLSVLPFPHLQNLTGQLWDLMI